MVRDLPPPEEIPVYSYQYVHNSPTGGAYIVETFESDQLLSEIFLGDGESSIGGTMCNKCVGLKPKPAPPLHFVPEIPSTTVSINANSTTTITSTTTLSSTTTASSSNSGNMITSSTASAMTTIDTAAKTDITTAIPVVINATEKVERRKREDLPVQKASVDGSNGESNILLPYDGFLDETSNYTGFIEVIGAYHR